MTSNGGWLIHSAFLCFYSRTFKNNELKHEKKRKPLLDITSWHYLSWCGNKLIVKSGLNFELWCSRKQMNVNLVATHGVFSSFSCWTLLDSRYVRHVLDFTAWLLDFLFLFSECFYIPYHGRRLSIYLKIWRVPFVRSITTDR